MRSWLYLLATPLALAASPALAAPTSFGPAVVDAELAAVRGTGPSGKPAFRMTDDLSLGYLRQTAAIGITMRELWLIDVGSPLIAANIRAARGD